MHKIKAICLGQKETFIDNFESIHQLQMVVCTRFKSYLTKKNVKQRSVKFILTYKDATTGNEELLKNMNVIERKNGAWFYLSVKRVCVIIIVQLLNKVVVVEW
jgi:hypothetical protein